MAKVQIERELIFKTYKDANYNKTMTARLLGISRSRLYRLIEKYELIAYC